MNSIQLNDTGVTIQLVFSDDNGVSDISDNEELQMVFTKPDESVLTVNASFKTDGTDGVVQYVFASGDLDVVGLWSVRALIKPERRTPQSYFWVKPIGD